MRSNKLHLRVSRIVTLGAIVFAVMASAISYTRTQSAESEAMKKALEQLFSTVQRNAEIAAYLDSTDLAEEVVESLSGNDIVSGVMLSSGNGLIITSSWSDADTEVLSFPLFAPFTAFEQTGEIKIQLNEDLLNSRVLKSALEQMFVLVIQVVVIAILVLILMLRVLTYPIQSIAASLHRIVPGDDNNLRCPKGHEEDEIGNLVNDINKLLESARQTIKQEQYLRNRMENLEKHFRLIFERASAGIFLLNHHFYLNSVNQAFKDIAGIALEERRADKLNIYFPDLFYDSTVVQDLLTEVLRTGKQAACDLRLNALTTGGECWLHCLFSIVKNDEGDNLIEGLVIDITERTFEMERILFESQHDALTQLLNRRAGEQRLNNMLINANRTNSQILLMLIDLDGFKIINDNYGHDAGDKVLIEISRRMQSIIRKEDILIRLGGDEFVIAFPIKEGGNDESELVKSKLQQQLTTEIVLGDGLPVPVGASIGSALYPRDGSDLSTLMVHADTAMYQMKKQRKKPVKKLLLMS
ncbi:sensor domain-containing diguanylate cyclase [Nitrosomonas sp.]|uniref:sensor domain-containing diguanylate cyclase n=1 Tax=Nitrosomonas sp. TaxID=42353 RepID=UPI001DD94328|nr:sensor domain-containing diguanylate cyclase [Nitrosomonas sp.]MBX3616545.1 diguanylate cyclase [Nitrosomonas sp.]